MVPKELCGPHYWVEIYQDEITHAHWIEIPGVISTWESQRCILDCVLGLDEDTKSSSEEDYGVSIDSTSEDVI